MKAEFLRIAGVKSEKEFYKKFPDENSFFDAYPQVRHLQFGGDIVEGDYENNFDNPFFQYGGGYQFAQQGLNVQGTSPADSGNQYGATTNVDLTKKVRFNQDPTQIPKGANVGGWNAFQGFVQSKGMKNDPKMNTPEGKQAYTDQMLKEFNDSDYTRKFPQNKVTPETIKAVQQYHKLSDPNVQVDQWVGSQTSQMRYPTPTVRYQAESLKPGEQQPAKPTGYLPVTYGNKRYVIDSTKMPAEGAPSVKDMVPYDEKVHGATLQKKYAPSNWDTWGTPPASVAPTPTSTHQFGGDIFQGGGEFLKALIKSAHKDVMKAGGQTKSSSPQGVTQEDFLNNRNNAFKGYLSNNAHFALAMEEANNLQSLHQEAMAKYGGQPKQYAQQGTQVMSKEWMQGMGHLDGTAGEGNEVNNDYVPDSGLRIDNQSGAFGFLSNQIQQRSFANEPTPEGAGVAGNQTMMNGQTDNPYPITSGVSSQQLNNAKPEQRQKRGFNGQLAAEGIIGGMSFLTAGLNSQNTFANQQLLKQRTNADNQFSVNQAGNANRGDYESNSGAFRPNQYTPVQSRGNMKMGGQHDEGEYMSEKEIRALRAKGYKIEYLD